MIRHIARDNELAFLCGQVMSGFVVGMLVANLRPEQYGAANTCADELVAAADKAKPTTGETARTPQATRLRQKEKDIRLSTFQGRNGCDSSTTPEDIGWGIRQG